MPINLDPNSSKNSKRQDLYGVHYEYDYPDGMDLKPGHDAHDDLVDLVMKRAQESRRNMENRYDSWNAVDRTLTAYVTPEKEKNIKDANASPPVVVPMSYATLETLLTYMTTAFLDNPIFRYQGLGSEDTIGAILLELIIDTHCRRAKVGLNLHTQFRDAFSYGFGVVSAGWERKLGKKAVKNNTGFISSISGLFKQTGVERLMKDGVVWEGNYLDNIDPYLFLPDTNVPITEIQKGEYVGWIDRDNIMSLLGQEEEDEDMFNVKYLKHIDGTSALTKSEKDERARQEGVWRNRDTTTETSPVDVVYMYCNIIPFDYDLGDSEYPEKWLFVVGGDTVLLKAQPLGLDHGDYPVGIAAPDFDGYSSSPISRMEVIYGLQETMDWLFTSHVANVKKAINDMLVVDPSLVNINDLRNPGPGRLLRLRRAAWGRGVEGAVKQLSVSDVTQGHMKDTTYITDIIQRVSAASDPLQGIMRSSGERRSATEARDSRSGALSRVEKAAKLMSLQSMQDIARMFASHTQQLMTEDTYVNIAGRTEEELREEYGADTRIKVRPEDLILDYDIVIHDGSSPGGEPADLWVQLYQILSQNPEVGQQFDMVRVFKHVARQLGAKNVDDFQRNINQTQVQTMPDEEAMREVERGNLIPMGDEIQ
jgi:hypothetical protein|tara:strand:+ start:17 stop:1966 length:1950 start_codon:yes stop_codon:yes gene_type:complete